MSAQISHAAYIIIHVFTLILTLSTYIRLYKYLFRAQFCAQNRGKTIITRHHILCIVMHVLSVDKSKFYIIL